MFTLSVLMPNYNHAKYIGEALESILSQSHKPIEILIGDDASTDNSVEIIQQFIKRDPIIRLIRNEKNMGAVSNLNKILHLAHGDYVYCAAADDIVSPGCFEKAMEALKRHPDVGIIFGKFIMVNPDGTKKIAEISRWDKETFLPPDAFYRDYLRLESSMTGCGPIVCKRKYLNEVGGFKPELGAFCNNFADWAVGLKYGACYVPVIFMQWRVLPNSCSTKNRENLPMALKIGERAASLMRSPEFRDTFPQLHVNRWATGWRKGSIKLHLYSRYVKKREAIMAALSERCIQIPFLQRLINLVLKIWFRIIRECYELYLNKTLPKAS